MDASNQILFKYFEKPMSSDTVLNIRTAMSEDSKMRSLANELIRRMMTTSEKVSMEVRRKVVDDYAQKLFNSGYRLD